MPQWLKIPSILIEIESLIREITELISIASFSKPDAAGWVHWISDYRSGPKMVPVASVTHCVASMSQ